MHLQFSGLIKTALFIGAIFFISLNGLAQYKFSDEPAAKKRLSQIASSAIAKVETIGQTEGAKDIQVIIIGSGDVENHSAVGVFGGVEGHHLLGVELLLRFAESLVANSNTDSIKNLLAKRTFYIFPNLSPDASAQYFATLKYERQANARPTDMDRDGEISEDPYDDLNKDSYITQMRIADPSGEWMAHPDDARVMKKADRSKGEKGTHRLLSEGIDNDKDEQFNEDGPGGIYFNKNFTYNFGAFEPGAGDFPVSEKETRALLDYLYERFNLYLLVSFSSTNSLSNPVKFNGGAVQKRVITGPYEKDAALNEMISEMYNDLIPKDNAPKGTAGKGDFSEWGYFHFGRLSYSTPAWWIPSIKEEKDTVNNTTNFVNTDKNETLNFLHWAQKNELPDLFVSWESVDHPDFPNKKVEVGGVKPFVMQNPPVNLIDDIAQKHFKFLISTAETLPEIKIQDAKVESVGNNLFRISMKVYNAGLMPTLTEIGEKTRWMRKLRADIILDNKQELVNGKKKHLLDKIEGDSATELSYLVAGKGKITIKVGSAHTGFDKVELDLK